MPSRPSNRSTTRHTIPVDLPVVVLIAGRKQSSSATLDGLATASPPGLPLASPRVFLAAFCQENRTIIDQIGSSWTTQGRSRARRGAVDGPRPRPLGTVQGLPAPDGGSSERRAGHPGAGGLRRAESASVAGPARPHRALIRQG